MRSETRIQDAVHAGDCALEGLHTEALEAMAAAGAEVVEIHRVLAKTGDNLVGELLKHNGTFYEWDHYPQGDVYDHETHGQYYYHAHPADQRFEHQHSHFPNIGTASCRERVSQYVYILGDERSYKKK